MSTLSRDVVIIGAGLAGLVCARRLRAAGRSVLVLEASERVGGRTRGQLLGGAAIDLGGQWIGPGQHRVLALAEELGLRTFPTHHAGKHVLSIDGRLRTFSGTIPRLSPRALLELGGVVVRSYGGSWRAPADLATGRFAARCDGRSAEHLAGRLRTREARGTFDAAFRTVFGAEPQDVSLLWYLFYARAGGGFFRLVDVEGGAQERRFLGGAYEICATLAAQFGDVVTLRAPVRRISQDRAGVLVTSDAIEVSARRAVVAAPLTLLGRIAFDPPLPAPRVELASGCRMGATVKVHARYGRAFWRERGLSGQAVANDGPMSVVFDNSSPDGAQAGLVGFVVGEEARRFGERDPEAQRRALIEQFEALFGPAARAPSELLFHDWSKEEWTGGCPVASPPPGLLLGRAAALRAPHERVHFAGTETARKNPGYLDGAVSSGERAAEEVLAGA